MRNTDIIAHTVFSQPWSFRPKPVRTTPGCRLLAVMAVPSGSERASRVNRMF